MNTAHGTGREAEKQAELISFGEKRLLGLQPRVAWGGKPSMDHCPHRVATFWQKKRSEMTQFHSAGIVSQLCWMSRLSDPNCSIKGGWAWLIEVVLTLNHFHFILRSRERRWCSWWEDIGGKLRPGGSNLRHWNCAIWQDHYWNIGLYCMNLLMLHYLSLMRQGSLPSCLKVSGLHNLTLEPVQPIWTPHLNLNCWQPQGVGKSSKTSQTRWVLVWLSTWRPRNLLGTSNLDSAAEFAEEHQRLQFAVSFCFSPFQKMQVSADLAQGTVDQAAYDRRSGFWSRLQAISSWRKTSENAG